MHAIAKVLFSARIYPAEQRNSYSTEEKYDLEGKSTSVGGLYFSATVQ